MAGTLTDAQLVTAAQAAGFTGQDLIIAVAVSRSEGQGDLNAIHATWATGGWNAFPTYRSGTYATYLAEAQAAAANPASVPPSETGMFLTAAGAVIPGVNLITGAAGAAKAVVEAPIQVLDWLIQPSNIVRILKVVIGAAGIIIAVAIIAKPVAEPILKTAGKTAATAALV